MNQTLQKSFDAFIQTLAADPVVSEYLSAKEAYTTDRALVVKVNEYNVQSTVLETESAKDDVDTLLIDSVKKKMSDLYDEICEFESMKRMTAAEEALHEIIGEFNHGLQHVINPHAHDHGCGEGGCSSCSGCH